MQKKTTKKLFFIQSTQEVWEYLTKPELIELWLTKTDFQPIAGHKFHFADKLGKIIHCEVLEVKPFTKLSYSWQYASTKSNNLLIQKLRGHLFQKKTGRNCN